MMTDAAWTTWVDAQRDDLAERRLLRFLGESERELPGGIAHSNGPCGAKARAARALHACVLI